MEEIGSKISAYLFLLLHSENFTTDYIFKEHVKFGQIFENQLKTLKTNIKIHLKLTKLLKLVLYQKILEITQQKVQFFQSEEFKNFNIEIYAFNNARSVNYSQCGDFKKYIHKWYDIFDLKDVQLADFIFKKQIDILIDLSGHTDGNRLLTFAQKPAPIQISCIGYPGTTGLKNIDYILCDERIAPKNIYDHLYVEKMLRIPSAAAWTPPFNSPKVKTLPALENKYITFGSFNYPRKITKKSIRAWSQILLKIPNSVLVQAAVDSHSIKENLKENLKKMEFRQIESNLFQD